MRKVFSYIKSHIYDIHAIITGVILVVIIYFVGPILQRKIDDLMERKLEGLPIEQADSKKLQRRLRLFWLICLMGAAIVMFAVLSVFSPFIDFSLQSGIMSGVYALCGRAFIEQIAQSGGKRKK